VKLATGVNWAATVSTTPLCSQMFRTECETVQQKIVPNVHCLLVFVLYM